MSAMDREINRNCPNCLQPVTIRYDSEGQSKRFERGSTVPHECTVTDAERRVGNRTLNTK